jgi:hypothetical protein
MPHISRHCCRNCVSLLLLLLLLLLPTSQVSCMPGGTASNIVAYIARGDMPLSIMMTTASTIMAVFTTPLLTSLLVGTLVPVDARAMFMSVLQLVLAPVIVGTAANQLFPRVRRRLRFVLWGVVYSLGLGESAVSEGAWAGGSRSRNMWRRAWSMQSALAKRELEAVFGFLRLAVYGESSCSQGECMAVAGYQRCICCQGVFHVRC